MYVAIGLENFEIWINKEEAICSKCKKKFVGTHMHPISTTKAIKAFKQNQGAFKK